MSEVLNLLTSNLVIFANFGLNFFNSKTLFQKFDV